MALDVSIAVFEDRAKILATIANFSLQNSRVEPLLVDRTPTTP